jgi:hypothetical protein
MAFHRNAPQILVAVLGLIIVDHQAGMDDAGNPTQEREQKTQDEAKDPPGHQDGDRWKDDAKKVAERFHGSVES